MMRGMNHRISVALELVPISPRVEQPATRRLQYVPRLQPGNLGDQGLDIGLQHIGGNAILTLSSLADVDVHLPNGMTSCPTLENNISHYIVNGFQRDLGVLMGS